MRNLFLATAALACLAAAPAQACKILPPGTPAEEARRALDDQTERMGLATTIFLAELVDIRPVEVDGSPVAGRRAVLRPLRALRGELPARPFALQHDAYTSCGLTPAWDALYGRPGQTYVVFATAAEPRQDTVTTAIRREDVVQPALLARLGRLAP